MKELRLAKIDNMEQAKQFLVNYRKIFNDKFAKAPRSKEDAHQVNNYKPREMALILSKHKPRKLSKNLTCQHKNIQYQIQTKAIGYTMCGSGVTVCELLTGEMVVVY